jgi:NAD(P)-dependent dehydrogenase (short-subunit alcohol dehydrogenase family)
MSGKLAGRKIIITGGAAGIGFTAAKIMVREGAAVALIDLNETQAAASAGSLVSEGATAVGFGADVTDAQQVGRAVKAVMETFGWVDGLFNNAGIAGFGSVHDSSPESWRSMWEVNVMGTVIASRAVLPTMMERKRGAIVNVGSVAGVVGIPTMAAYCAAKGAVVNLTRQMAADYAKHGIRVNCVCPGTVAETAMGRSLVGSDTSAEAMARRLTKYPIGRFGEPQEIGEAVTFLLSDAASFCVGSIFAVNGGMTSI